MRIITIVSRAIFILLLALVPIETGSAQLVQPRGSDETFDLLTWNVREFPRTGFRTIDTLAILVNCLNVDMIAFQEIQDTLAFDQLMAQLPAWNGIYSPDEYFDGSYQKTAVIWRTDRSNIVSMEPLFVGYSYQFPRPPIHCEGVVQFAGNEFDFNLIAMHLKAGETDDDRLRRQSAVVMLKAYLDNIVPNADDRDWIVVGDWNDILEDPNNLNVFLPLLNDSLDYRFLTLPMAGNPYWASLPSWNSLIDHQMITTYADYEYGDGNCITLRLDDEYSNYFSRISDHRPVMSQFIGHPTAISESPLPKFVELFRAYPNPFNAQSKIEFMLSTVLKIKLELFDIMGRKIAILFDCDLPAGYHAIEINAANWPSGIYFARLDAIDRRTTENFSITIKLSLLK